MKLKLKKPRIPGLGKGIKKAATKTGKAIGTAAKKTGRAISNTAQKIGEQAKNVGEIIVLKPFEGLMRTILKTRGIAAPSNLEDLAKTFYMEVVKKNSFDEQYYFQRDNAAFIDYEQHNNADNFAPPAISAIISGIVSYIKNLRARKEAGVPLTPTQEKVVQLSHEADKKAEEIKDDEVKREVGSFFTDYWWVLLLAVVGFVYLKKN